MDLIEVRLQPPLRFDNESGYWTGEPDTGILDKALSAVALPSDVLIVRDPSGVTLRGRRSAVVRAADLLRARGLEKQEP